MERSELFAVSCHVRKGEGAGTFGKFQEVFLAERQDYGIDVYKDAKVSIITSPMHYIFGAATDGSVL